MSLQAMTRALAVSALSTSEKFVLVALANYANERMECWPSYATLAHDTKLSRRQIIRLIASLEGLGYVQKLRRRTTEGRQGTNALRLVFDGDTMSPWSNSRVTPTTRQSDIRDVSRVTPMSPEPVIEPVTDPSRVRVREADGAAHALKDERQEVGRMMRDLATQLGSRRVRGRR